MAVISKEQAIAMMNDIIVIPTNGVPVVNATHGLQQHALPLSEALLVMERAKACYLRDDKRKYRLMLDCGDSEVWRFEVDDRVLTRVGKADVSGASG
jgi:hypothetical protein